MKKTKIKIDTVNMAINLAILGLLIYLAVAVKQLQDEVFWPDDVMRKANNDQIGQVIEEKLYMGWNEQLNLEENIRLFLNEALDRAVENWPGKPTLN
jgi:hypothetical protein